MASVVQEIGLTSSATKNASPSRQPVDPEPSRRSRMYVRNVVSTQCMSNVVFLLSYKQFNLERLWSNIIDHDYRVFMGHCHMGTFLVGKLGQFHYHEALFSHLQLGEAILTEHTPTGVVAAIRLTDTRTRDSADDERETFLPKFGSEAADGENGDLDEYERSEVSTLSADQAHQYRADSLETGNRNFENESERNGGLSSKAGIIIVRSLISVVVY